MVNLVLKDDDDRQHVDVATLILDIIIMEHTTEHTTPQLSPISPAELHLLFVLLDSSLPTGGFVSSSGLESYAKHGFLSTRSPAAGGGTTQRRLVKYAEEAVENYAMGTVGFVGDAWRCLEGFGKGKGKECDLDETLKMVIRLDDGYEAMTLNHVTRRSSTAQGIAMLTLLAKGFSLPGYMDAEGAEDGEEIAGIPPNVSSRSKRELVDMFRKAIRSGQTAGHLPVCWGLLANASGLALGG
jgi:urease accessory protein